VTEATRKLLESLLAWDRARLADIAQKRPRLDNSVYRDRVARAEAALATPPATWGQEIREHIQVLIELAGVEAMASPAPMGEVQSGGRGRAQILRRRLRPMLAPSGENVLRVMAAAAELGVLEALRRTGETAWRDLKGI